VQTTFRARTGVLGQAYGSSQENGTVMVRMYEPPCGAA
jgi:hypothetical protein